MSASSRSVYRHQDLARLLNPRHIAIYGASTNAKSFGARTIANAARYTGTEVDEAGLQALIQAGLHFR